MNKISFFLEDNQKSFDIFDSNDDGYITFDELTENCKKL